jgi:hypothetical protein
MAIPTATPQPAAHSALRRLVAQHPVAAFLVMVFAFTYLSALVPFLTQALLHSTSNTTVSPGGFGGEFIPRGSALWIVTGVFAVAAVLLVVFTRGRLSYEPERTAQPADAAPQGGAPLAHP